MRTPGASPVWGLQRLGLDGLRVRRGFDRLFGSLDRLGRLVGDGEGFGVGDRLNLLFGGWRGRAGCLGGEDVVTVDGLALRERDGVDHRRLNGRGRG